MTIPYLARAVIMSAEAGRVATLLLEESFGGVVGKVASSLLKHGGQSLPEIVKGIDLDKEQVWHWQLSY